MTLGKTMMQLRSRFPTLRPESDSFLHVDVLRFVASMGIVILHFSSKFEYPSGFDWIGVRLDDLRYFVDLFFCISGLIMASLYSDKVMSQTGYLGFLRKRLARLGPLHWATTGLYVLFGLLTLAFHVSFGDQDRYQWNCLVPNLLLIHAWGVCDHLSFNLPSWSISAEMAMYILLPVFLVVMRGKLWQAIVPIAVILLLEVLPGRHWYDRTVDYGVLRALPGFLLGIAAHGWRDKISRIPMPNLLMTTALIAFAVEILLGTPGLITVITAYVAVVAGYAADLQGDASRIVRRLAPLGQLTYSMYMLHPLVQSLLVAAIAVHVLKLHGGILDTWIAVCLVAVVPALSYVSLVFFETPLRKRLSGTRSGRATAKQRREIDFAP